MGRQPGESSKAYAAFRAYRDLGPHRAIVKALKTSGKSAANLRQWEYWSSQHRWVERAAAYDDHSERSRLAQLEKERREMNVRQARIGLMGQNIAVRQMETLLAKTEQGTIEMKPLELARWLDTSVKTERAARAEPTDVQKRVGPNVGPIQVDQRAFIYAVRAALGFRDPEWAEIESGNSRSLLPPAKLRVP